MTALLVPVGATTSQAAQRAVVVRARREQATEVHLVNVQAPIGAYIGRYVGARAVRNFQHDQGEAALANMERALRRAGIAATPHIRIGTPAIEISQVAREVEAEEILVDPGDNLLANISAWLLALRIRRRVAAPVIVVMDPLPSRLSPLPRWRAPYPR